VVLRERAAAALHGDAITKLRGGGDKSRGLFGMRGLERCSWWLDCWI
jgi:hypothetical protein